jgi:hypothetical protein
MSVLQGPMTLRTLGTMAAAMMFLVTAAAQPANASLITFSTSGAFDSTGTATLTEGGITITFTGVTETVDAADPGWFGSFGTFTVTGGNPSTGGLDAETFTLTITQVLPPGMTDFPATMEGQINKNNSSAFLTFTSPLTKEISGVFYTVTTPVVDLPAPSDSPNTADIGGHVIEANQNGGPIPEPGSLLLFGTASVLLGRSRRRNRR